MSPSANLIGTPIPQTFADYQALALQQKQQAQRVTSRDGNVTYISDGLKTPSGKDSAEMTSRFPRLRRVACHQRELEEKEFRAGLLGEDHKELDRKHSNLKRKAEELVGLLRK